MLADYDKIPVVEEYLNAIADGSLFTACLDPVDVEPKHRLTTGPLRLEIGNPFHRPPNSDTSYPVVPGSYMDMDG